MTVQGIVQLLRLVRQVHVYQKTIKTLLAILKMAEHICACHRVLGAQPDDHEWDSVSQLVLEYVGLSEYDFVCLKESIRELGVG